ncbi:acetyl-CoA carboxylase biotin carboxyl carrier protein [Geomicrobium sp. JCM 19039]|uniref:acetyl-CoA carboxylase biotin carboxyl carrier protein n=1 Tax=Geomicrobium sp. JCM 19039 TaxID=1460636 RepID=UPI00045F10E7|nr:acetyl-CoA carboxylase biotin carboxyl carrier protein [Geomicrobium sp. JCM 19039]GAK11792.1 biotin carboxyl carrier protein of acetyl-CoA carboxylase [Geomicrobium sp. JCM 19039]
MYTIKEIKELIEAVDTSSLTELELKSDNDTFITLRKQTTTVVEQAPVVSHVPSVQQSGGGSDQGVTPSTDQQEKQESTKPSVSENTEQITSPMVGTFYRAASPDAEPYVKVGDSVNNESIVCIVEAMKLMNELEAEVSGEIVEVLVENGELVDYGQPLFLVKA